jgi:hypothetical protein
MVSNRGGVKRLHGGECLPIAQKTNEKHAEELVHCFKYIILLVLQGVNSSTAGGPRSRRPSARSLGGQGGGVFFFRFCFVCFVLLFSFRASSICVPAPLNIMSLSVVLSCLFCFGSCAHMTRFAALVCLHCVVFVLFLCSCLVELPFFAPNQNQANFFHSAVHFRALSPSKLALQIRFRLVSFRFGSFRLGSVRFGSFRLGSFRFSSVRFVSVQLVSFRFVSFRFVVVVVPGSVGVYGRFVRRRRPTAQNELIVY